VRALSVVGVVVLKDKKSTAISRGLCRRACFSSGVSARQVGGIPFIIGVERFLSLVVEGKKVLER